MLFFASLTVIVRAVIPIFLVVVGVIGNFISICVLFRLRGRKPSTVIFLIALTISDTFILIDCVLVKWFQDSSSEKLKNLTGSYGLNFDDISELHCKMIVFLQYATPQFSSWMHVAMTIDQIRSALHPHKVIGSYAGKVILLTIVCTAVTNSHVFYAHDVIDPCELHHDHTSLKSHVWSVFDVIIRCLIPGFVIILGSLFIAMYMTHKKQTRSSHREKSKRTSGVPHVCTVEKKENMDRHFFVPQSDNNEHSYALLSNEISIETPNDFFVVMIVVLNIVYVACAAPVATIDTINPSLWHEDSLKTRALHLLMFTSSALHFPLYTSQRIFRKHLQALLTCKKYVL